MLFFVCSSMFHTLVSYLLIKTVYKDSLNKKVMLLIDTVDSLLEYKTKFQKCGIWDKVQVVKIKHQQVQVITEQVDKFNFSDSDVIHTFGPDAFSILLTNKLLFKARLILTEEGYPIYEAEKNYAHVSYEGYLYQLSRVDEIWVFDLKRSNNHLSIPESEIPIRKFVDQPDFRAQVQKEVSVLYGLRGGLPESQSVIFFDQYFSEVNQISDEIAVFLMKQLDSALGMIDYLIKPHPGEPEVRKQFKYMDMGDKILPDSNVPWEAFLICDQSFLQKSDRVNKILITYSSGSIFTSKGLLGIESSHVIYLNRILNRYLNEPLSLSFLETYQKAYGTDGVYFPESYTEVRKILWELLKPAGPEPNWDYLLQKEQFQENEMLLKFYKENWKNLPPTRNVTTLYFINDESISFQNVDVLITQKVQKFNFRFTVPENFRKNLNQVRWYALRARKVGVKLTQILCIMPDGATKELLPEDVQFFEGAKNQKGFICLSSFDPNFYFTVPRETTEVCITGIWGFDDTYQGAVEVANQMASGLAVRLEQAEAGANSLRIENEKLSVQIVNSQMEIETTSVQAQEAISKKEEELLQLRLASNIEKKEILENTKKVEQEKNLYRAKLEAAISRSKILELQNATEKRDALQRENELIGCRREIGEKQLEIFQLEQRIANAGMVSKIAPTESGPKKKTRKRSGAIS